MTIQRLSVAAPLSSRLALSVCCWGLMVLASSLPEIFWRQAIPLWFTFFRVGTLIILLCASFFFKSLKHLRGYMLALLAIILGWDIIRPILMQDLFMSSLVQRQPLGIQLFVFTLLRFMTLPLVLLTILGSRLTRKELFLVKGDMHAQLQLTSLQTRRCRVTWKTVSIFFLFCSGIVLPAYLMATMHPNFYLLQRVVINLPAIMFGAALNTTTEEIEYRCVLLARLQPVIGQSQALLLTTLLFAIGHFYGQPSGLFGVVLATIAGWLWGKSMLDTGGWGWTWSMHFVQDVVIYSFILINLP